MAVCEEQISGGRFETAGPVFGRPVEILALQLWDLKSHNPADFQFLQVEMGIITTEFYKNEVT